MVATRPTTSSKPKKTRRSLKKGATSKSSHPSEVDKANDGLLPTDTAGGSQELDNDLITDRDGDDMDVIEIDPPPLDTTSGLSFPPLPAAQVSAARSETRRIPIPPHRMTPLQKDWINIFSPLTEMCGLQVRMNLRRKCVEMRVLLIRRLPAQ